MYLHKVHTTYINKGTYFGFYQFGIFWWFITEEHQKKDKRREK